MAFDRTKPYRARDGRKAEIVATSKDGRFLVVYDDGEYYAALYPNGHYWSSGNSESEYDLINLPEKRVVIINHYPDGTDTVHIDKGLAEGFRGGSRYACTVVEYERPVFDGE